ncbi:hypothetical protein MMC16_006206 [Acarospora aff. strigata]|nr:hypothetical protein [Acarospora aff. strigata]
MSPTPLPAHSKRAPSSTTAQPKKPPLHISPTTTIADTAVLTGTYPITLGANTVIHPRARLQSTYGPITVGEGCVVWEKSCVGVQQQLAGSGGREGRGDGVEGEGRGSDAREEEGEEKEGVVLGRGVIVEAGAIVEARGVGDGSLIECGARVGVGVVLGKHCKISPLATIPPHDTLPDFTVVYHDGNGQRRRIDRSGFQDVRMKVAGRQVEVLRGLVPSQAAKFR